MTWEVREGDCVSLMRAMPAGSVDAVVCDPPAGIGFMGRTWDHHRGGRNEWVEWMADVFREALRVCKPGAHAFVWSLPRTSHWTGSALELAGWEVRDVVSHMFGSGFPKSHNLPNGYGTALKPAAEFWWLARKPLSGTVAGNVLEHGTGALNVDGCRVGFASNGDQETAKPGGRATSKEGGDASKPDAGRGLERQGFERGDNSAGRWPANVVLSHTEGCVQVGTRKVRGDKNSTRGQRTVGEGWASRTGDENSWRGHGEPVGYGDADGTETVGAWSCTPGCPVRLLDEQTGELPGRTPRTDEHGATGTGVTFVSGRGHDGFGDQGGGPSRFFPTFTHDTGETRFRYCAKSGTAERSAGLSGERNIHPTCKPVSLMRWLVRLVTPPGGTVLDPFTGSGTTGIACALEGFDFIGLEKQGPDYVKIAEARIAWWHKHCGDGEAAEILAAGEARDEVEATGQLGMFD